MVATVPASVSVSGEEIVEAAAMLDSIGYIMSQVVGGQDSPLSNALTGAAVRLYVAAFGAQDWTDDLEPLGLTKAMYDRSDALTAEWLEGLQARQG